MSFRYGDIVVNNGSDSTYYKQIGRVTSVYAEYVIVEYFDTTTDTITKELELNGNISLWNKEKYPKVKVIFIPSWYYLPSSYPIHLGSVAEIKNISGSSFLLNTKDMGESCFCSHLLYCSVVD